jgi:hypothetical protein
VSIDAARAGVVPPVPRVGVLSSALVIGETIERNDAIALALVCSALFLVLFERRPAGPAA